jgi:hypothetical protein
LNAVNGAVLGAWVGRVAIRLGLVASTARGHGVVRLLISMRGVSILQTICSIQHRVGIVAWVGTKATTLTRVLLGWVAVLVDEAIRAIHTISVAVITSILVGATLVARLAITYRA